LPGHNNSYGSNQAKPSQAKPNQTKPNQIKPNQIKPNQTKSNQIKPNGGSQFAPLTLIKKMTNNVGCGQFTIPVFREKNSMSHSFRF
jgi:hypothetical protein